MVEYKIADISEKAEIIDFINYVFSHDHRPHDFKKLIPKSYADHVNGLGATHYLAKDDGKIKAVVANRIIDASACGKSLKLGLIGNVSVHPYSRGSGYMRTLMHNAIADSKASGVDIMILAGQRQRYGYYGFENAGACLQFKISKSNIRHCFADLDCSDISFHEISEENPTEIDYAKSLYEKRPYFAIRKRDEFVDICHTWESSFRAVVRNGKMIGYTYGGFGEIVLENEADFAAVMKALFEEDGMGEAFIKVELFEKERAELLINICEDSSIQQLKMIKVLCWERVIDALLNLKSKTTALADGEADITIEDETFRITVSDGKPEVKKISTKSDTIRFTEKQAILTIFNMKSLLIPDMQYKNWFPLPLVIDSPDTY